MSKQTWNVRVRMEIEGTVEVQADSVDEAESEAIDWVKDDPDSMLYQKAEFAIVSAEKS